MKGKHNGRFRRFVGKGNRAMIQQTLEKEVTQLAHWEVAMAGTPLMPAQKQALIDRQKERIDILLRQRWALENRDATFHTEVTKLTTSEGGAPLFRPCFDDEWEMVYVMKRPTL